MSSGPNLGRSELRPALIPATECEIGLYLRCTAPHSNSHWGRGKGLGRFERFCVTCRTMQLRLKSDVQGDMYIRPIRLLLLAESCLMLALAAYFLHETTSSLPSTRHRQFSLAKPATQVRVVQFDLGN